MPEKVEVYRGFEIRRHAVVWSGCSTGASWITYCLYCLEGPEATYRRLAVAVDTELETYPTRAVDYGTCSEDNNPAVAACFLFLKGKNLEEKKITEKFKTGIDSLWEAAQQEE